MHEARQRYLITDQDGHQYICYAPHQTWRASEVSTNIIVYFVEQSRAFIKAHQEYDEWAPNDTDIISIFQRNNLKTRKIYRVPESTLDLPKGWQF